DYLGSSPDRGSTVSEPGSLSRAQSPKANCLEVDRPLLTTSGLSEKVLNTLLQSRKPSTNRAYSRVVKTFQKWCFVQKVNADKPSVNEILEFLQQGLDKGLSLNTLKVQISAISAYLSSQLSADPLIQRFLKAAQRIRPPVLNPVPQWDLNIVLEQLCEPPFEPLKEIDLKYLSLKTAFLTAITSASRVSEIQALAFKEPYLQFFPDQVVLRTLPDFSPKVASKVNINQEIRLPSFCPNPSTEEELRYHSLDVCRALKRYLLQTESFRKSENLFVVFSGKNKGLTASKLTLSRWLKDTIQTCYIAAKLSPPIFIKAHSTRATSTSWAERLLVPPNQICKAATWSSLHTFSKHYRLDIDALQETAFGRAILQSVYQKK
uniref:Core-binding (CB) domain-containing protein n=1 Tax=Xenopus tropicalis TaxID=8364 RepID=A0A803JRA6_XENTR